MKFLDLNGVEILWGKMKELVANCVGRKYSGSTGGEIFNSYSGTSANEASGNYSHAEGYNTTASGNGSHAEGCNTTASGRYSHAEGYNTTASGDCSHAEGSGTTASGDGSHAEGNSTTASGIYSHAEGRGTVARNDYEHAEGAYNVSNASSNVSGQTRHSVGIGTAPSPRKNAWEIMANGDAYLYGVGGYDGTNASASTSSSLQSVINQGIARNLATLGAATDANYEALTDRLADGTYLDNARIDQAVKNGEIFKFTSDSVVTDISSAVQKAEIIALHTDRQTYDLRVVGNWMSNAVFAKFTVHLSGSNVDTYTLLSPNVDSLYSATNEHEFFILRDVPYDRADSKICIWNSPLQIHIGG